MFIKANQLGGEDSTTCITRWRAIADLCEYPDRKTGIILGMILMLLVFQVNLEKLCFAKKIWPQSQESTGVGVSS